MTDIPEGRITAGKLQSDELQIHLGDIPAANTPAHTDTKVVNSKKNRPQLMLWWIMVIIGLLTLLNLCSTIITCGPMLFANVTRIYVPSLLCSNQ